MKFHEALDELANELQVKDIAQPFDIATNSLRTMKAKSKNSTSYKPPLGWQGVICALANQRIARLKSLVDVLEKEEADEWRRRTSISEEALETTREPTRPAAGGI